MCFILEGSVLSHAKFLVEVIMESVQFPSPLQSSLNWSLWTNVPHHVTLSAPLAKLGPTYYTWFAPFDPLVPDEVSSPSPQCQLFKLKISAHSSFSIFLPSLRISTPAPARGNDSSHQLPYLFVPFVFFSLICTYVTWRFLFIYLLLHSWNSYWA